MTTRLNQMIAIEPTVKSKAHAVLTGVYHVLQKEKLLSGIARNYKPLADDGEQQPPESGTVQTRVEEVLANLSIPLARLFDVTATKDNANTTARADVVVNGVTLLADMPVTYLLFLEKWLVDLRTLITKLPVLDPSEVWTFNDSVNAWASQSAQTARTKKVPRSFTKAKATVEHPEQAEMYWEDIVVGLWTTTKFSGALPATRVAEMMARVEALQAAVKFAREEANGLEIVDVKTGRVVFDYLLA